MKKIKRGQALMETVVVLGLYFFIIGFTISMFQVMYNRLALSVAAYDAARTATVYESSVNSSKGFFDTAYNRSIAEDAAIDTINELVLAVNALHYKIEIYGINDINDLTGPDFNGQQLYARAVIWGRMDYLFPLIDPNLEQVFKQSIDFNVSFVMPRERLWNS